MSGRSSRPPVGTLIRAVTQAGRCGWLMWGRSGSWAVTGAVKASQGGQILQKGIWLQVQENLATGSWSFPQLTPDPTPSPLVTMSNG